MDVYPNLERARVASANRGLYLLWTATGAELRATLSGSSAETPAVGDWVEYEPDTCRIRAVLRRQTCLIRRKAGRATEEQIIAANVDIMFIVMALDGDFNLRRLERYLVMAEESGTSPVVILNKSDLCEDLVPRLNELDQITQAPVVVMSAIDRGSVSQLARHIEPGQTGALLGSSGVGKSTIINALLGGDQQPTKAVRENDSKGRHTTTQREMFRLSQGWILIDMPGMRELEPWTSAEHVTSAFADIEALAPNCQFRDCRHKEEPGCAVTGAIDPARLASYHKLHAELTTQERKRIAKVGCKGVRQILKIGPKHWRGA